MGILESERIVAIKKIVQEACKDDWNWQYHIVPVVEYAKMLAARTGADEDVVEVAAWLHDLTRLRGDEEGHNITGALEAERILPELGYDLEFIRKVSHCIKAHRGKKDILPETTEAKCVASADAMAHIGDLPAMFYVIYVVAGKPVEEGRDWMRNKIERSWNKLMPEAKDMMKEKYEAAKIIFS